MPATPNGDNPNADPSADQEREKRLAQLRSKSAVDLTAELDTLQTKVATAFEEAGDETDLSKVKCLGTSGSEATLEALRNMNADADVIRAALNEKQEAAGIQVVFRGSKPTETSAPTTRDEGDPDIHAHGAAREVDDSIGGQFVQAPQYMDAQARGGSFQAMGDITLENGAAAVFDSPLHAATFKRDAGWVPPQIRSSRVELADTQPVELLDLLPIIPIGTSHYRWMMESAITNTAAAKAEGAALPELALTLTEQNVPVERVGAYIPVTDEQLQDVSGARGYLNARVPFLVRQKVSDQVLNGNGTAPNLKGIINTSDIGAQAKTNAIKLIDVFLKARTKVRKAAYMLPDTVLVTPDTYEALLIAKDDNGNYLLGGPGARGTRSLWGVNVVENDYLAANTALMGAFRSQCAMVMRRDIAVETGRINDQFIKNMQTIRAYLRMNVAVFRTTAFCKITALNT